MMNENDKPLSFYFTPQVTVVQSIFKWVFSLNGIFSISIIILSVALYIQHLKLDVAVNKNDSYELQIQLLNTSLEQNKKQLELCFDNYNQLKNSIQEAAKISQKYNIEILDLQNKVDRFNKLNSRTIDLFAEQNLAKNCSEAIDELLSEFK